MDGGPLHPRMQPPPSWPDTDTARTLWQGLSSEQRYELLLMGLRAGEELPKEAEAEARDTAEAGLPPARDPDQAAPMTEGAPGAQPAPWQPGPDPRPGIRIQPRHSFWNGDAGKKREAQFLAAISNWACSSDPSHPVQQSTQDQRTPQDPPPQDPDRPMEPPPDWPRTRGAARFWGALTDELKESFLQLGPLALCPLDVLYDGPEDTLSTPEAAPDRTASAVGSAPGQPVAPSPPAPDPSQATGAPPQYRDWAWGAGPARGPRFWDASQAAQRHRASQRGPRGSDHPSPTGPPTHSQSGGGVKRCRSAEPPPIPPVDPPTPCQPHGPETEALQDLTQPPPKGPGTRLAPWVTHGNLDATEAGIDHDISENSAARPPGSPHHAASATGPRAGGPPPSHSLSATASAPERASSRTLTRRTPACRGLTPTPGAHLGGKPRHARRRLGPPRRRVARGRHGKLCRGRRPHNHHA